VREAFQLSKCSKAGKGALLHKQLSGVQAGNGASSTGKFQQFPMMAVATSRLLSAHVTSCSTERNWSQFGSIFTKTKNRLALERARKIAYVRSNNRKGATGADEEVMLSVADVADEEEGEAEQAMDMDE